MKKYEYINYAHYKECQIAGYEKKKDRCWAKKENIECIAEFLKPYKPLQGLCHGTRGGFEQKWFFEFLGIPVLGTEIGKSTAANTIRMDFNKVELKLIEFADFIYSNSFDHAYDPESTIRIWASQVKPGGHIILEWDKRNEHTGEVSKPVNKTDPISMTIKELETKLPEFCNKLTHIVTLDMPVVTFVYRKAVIFEVK